MLSPAQLRRLIEQAHADEATLRSQANLVAEQRALLEKMLERAEQGLRTTETERTIRSMDVNTNGQSPSVKRGAGRATRKHPAQKKLYEKGKTITDIAADLGEGRPRVSAWFADGDANRPIPRRHAEKLRDRYGIPLSAWSRVAD